MTDPSCVDVRRCAWCKNEISSSRRDAITCSKRCRQARHRFRSTVGTYSGLAGGQPRRLAYADPPYPGLSARYYRNHPDYAGEVDHAALISSLAAEYDAWALSTSAATLPQILALCPPGVMVAAWFRGERPHAGATRPLNAWEPVIYAGEISRRPSTGDAVVHDVSRGDRHATPGQRDASAGATCLAGPPRRVDSLIHVARPRTTDPGRVVGAKPAAFCRWLFELLGAQPGDDLVDVFPGSGGVAAAWRDYTSELALTPTQQRRPI